MIFRSKKETGRILTIRSTRSLRSDQRESGRVGSYLSCFKAYSNILILRTRSLFRFSWPFLSPCRNAILACKKTPPGELRNVPIKGSGAASIYPRTIRVISHNCPNEGQFYQTTFPLGSESWTSSERTTDRINGVQEGLTESLLHGSETLLGGSGGPPGATVTRQKSSVLDHTRQNAATSCLVS